MLPFRPQKFILNCAAALVVAGASGTSDAQTTGIDGSAPGAAEIGTEAFVAGPNAFSRLDTFGFTGSYRQFFPDLGLLSVVLEGFSNDGVRRGTTMLKLSGLRWLGWKYNLTLGDFIIDSHPISGPFNNLIDPLINATGFKVEATHESLHYAVFAGEGTVFQGVRIPFHFGSGQKVAGASMSWKARSTLQVGARALLFSREEPAQLPGTLATGFALLPAAWSVAATALWQPTRNLRVYADGGASHFWGSLGNYSNGLWSGVSGVSYDSNPITLKLDYAQENLSILPLAGYFPTARRGPFGSLQYRPSQRLNLYASASTLHTNLALVDGPGEVQSQNVTMGATLQALSKTELSAQYTALEYRANTTSPQFQSTAASMTTLTAGRSFTRHTVRVYLRDFRTESAGAAVRSQSAEFEDSVRFRRISFTGAARTELQQTQPHTVGIFGRGSVQFTLGPVTAYASMDAGTDHLSQSVLASSAIRTNTAGLRWQFGKHWTLSAEAWSSRFALSGSPDEILSTSSAPVPTYLLSTNSQWNTLIRLSRQFKWGGGRSLDDVSQWAAARMPLVGSIVGFVQEEGSQGNRPASYVTLTLDNWKSAVTDLRGYYEFMQVSEGTHHVSIDMRRLPVDYEPAAAMATTALVRPQGRARADFVVYPLCTIKGVVHGPDALTMGSIVIRLEPGDQRTTPNELGQFYFEGLRESDYTIVIDKSSLPPDAVLRSEERQPIRATVGAPAFVEYQVEIVPPQKPVKTIP